MPQSGPERTWTIGFSSLLPALLLSTLLVAGPVAAMSLDQAVQQVKRQTNGKVLSARTVKQGQRRVHQIRVLTGKGQVQQIQINAGGR
jgi:uncharacterized membrane protein YkoI